DAVVALPNEKPPKIAGALRVERARNIGVPTLAVSHSVGPYPGRVGPRASPGLLSGRVDRSQPCLARSQMKKPATAATVAHTPMPRWKVIMFRSEVQAKSPESRTHHFAIGRAKTSVTIPHTPQNKTLSRVPSCKRMPLIGLHLAIFVLRILRHREP